MATIARERFNWQSVLAYGLGALSLAGIITLYLLAKQYLELPLLIGLALALAITLALQKIKTLPWHDIIVGFGVLTNLIMGVVILLSQNLGWAGTYPSIQEGRLALAGAFIASSAISLASTVLSPGKWKYSLSKINALPWLGWIALNVTDAPYAHFVPAACMAATLLGHDLIPWSHLKLPEDDILGRRLIRLGALIQSAFLIGFALLLNAVNRFHPLNMMPSGINFFTVKDVVLLLNLGAELVFGYALISLILSIHQLANSVSGEVPPQEKTERDEFNLWHRRIARLTRPFETSRVDIKNQMDLQTQQMSSISLQLEKEKRRSSQLTLLSELSQQLEAQLDMPVAAQLAVNTLQKSLECSFTALYLNNPERREMVALAAAGTRVSILPPGYRQDINVGVLGRTARVRKTQVVNDCLKDPDYFQVENEPTRSMVIVPLIDHGHLKGLLEVSDNHVNAFSGHDVQIAEAVAAELLRAWERSEYNQRLTDLIQAGISLTIQPDPHAAVQEVANIARQTLRARFTYVTLLDQEGNFTRTAYAGNAPRLLKSLMDKGNKEPLMQASLNAAHPFRIRDIRKYKHASHIEIDYAGLRSLIAVPIRVHRLSVGAMLAFGKQGEVFFTENDESLASLLASQAAAAIESAWLSHELRTTLATTTQLYQLSFHVIQAEELSDAATYIAEASQKLCGASSAGILLFTPNRRVEAEVQLDANGRKVTPQHPMQYVQRALQTEQSIFESSEHDLDVDNVCFPLKTPSRTYGVLWLTIPGNRGMRYATTLQTLANQATVALERAILLVESRAQAKTIKEAYQELETTYDHTLAALMSALDARDRETEGHSTRVAKLARLLGQKQNLPPDQLKSLERGSLLHDIGKIGISDTILHKPGPLSEEEWKIMRLHPDIGARIVEDIPFLQDTLSVVRYHQERWDGSGYPIGLTGKNIPLLARIFAVADAFDALTSNRPYRKQISTAEAIQYLKENAASLFDPEIVNALVAIDADGLIAKLGFNE